MMTAASAERQQWDQFVRQHPRGHVLQLSAWGELKSRFGWQQHRVAVLDSDHIVAAGALILFRPLPFRLGTMAYLPMGPLLRDNRFESELWQAIDHAAKSHGARFLKWEPGFYLADTDAPDFDRLGFRPSPQTIQPPRTIMIRIDHDDETILARMNQGTRRKIRQSIKGEVNYFHGTHAEMATFNQLMQITGQRNEFGVHDPAYYDLAYDLFVPQGDATVILAEHEGDPLAAIMVYALGDTAWYISGASSSVKRNLMASYGIQWQAIQWARSRGCRYYDMWGVPDEDEAVLEAQFQDRSDELWGVYGFKRGWGGEVIRSAGTWDKVYNPLVYTAYNAALRLRRT